MTRELTPELEKWARHIIELSQEFGLSFHPIEFLLIPPKELNAIAAYTGFPRRMNHWRYGQEFESIHKSYKYGASKIYELVINNNPVYAYLLTTNTLANQKLVMAHVCGHADFFYNNCWFADTNRNMVDQMANNAIRFRRIAEIEGEDKAENFLDICYSLENLIDPFETVRRNYDADDEEDYKRENPNVFKFDTKEYMDRYINPKEFIEEQKKAHSQKKQKERNFPKKPERDILGFLVQHAPLKKWQRDILAMVREEAYYFAPQRMTKVGNEGWASYIHSKMMTEQLADASEIVDYCDVHSGVVSGTGFNPYKIGIELFRDIEDRWNRGAFGKEWEQCDSYEKKLSWDKKLGLGKSKVMQVRKTHNDITLIDQFLTPEFCRKHELFFYKKTDEYFPFVEESRNFHKIKNQLLTQLSNGGQPVIELVNANYKNAGELLLRHVHDGRTLDVDQGRDCLKNIFKIWTRPTHIMTVNSKNNNVIWHYNGEEHSVTEEEDEEFDLDVPELII